MIDLRSDTVTKPTPAMQDAMFTAKVGDDVFEEDPTVNGLEEKAAVLFGMEASIFCPSGTMTNQVAVRVHTRPGDEVICDRLSHIYNYEGGGIALNSGASVRLLQGDRGRFTARDVAENINPEDVHFPVTSLVAIENTCNKGGGSVWDIKEIRAIRDVCRERGFGFHLDGARLFNALAVTGESPAVYGALFDTISICLSKGLGAPVGSLLLGNRDMIKKARRVRKAMGGGMRQAGLLAAAGIYALEHHVDRLKEDHLRAKQLGDFIMELPYVISVVPVETNIIIFELIGDVKRDDFVRKLAQRDIKVSTIGSHSVRMVTHLNFDDTMLEKVTTTCKSLQ